MKLNIGVFVDCFRRPVAEGLSLAAELKAQSFQVYVTKGAMLAANMSRQARADFVKRYKDLGLELSATCGDFGLNFGDDAALKAKEPALVEAILQTADLKSSIMTTHIGGVGDEPNGAKYIVSQVRLDLRNDVFHRGCAPLALQDAPICRVFPLQPLGGPAAALQTSRAVQHFRSLHGLLKCCTKEKALAANLRRLGDFAAAHGVTLATETGLESGATLRRILERAETKGLGVNFDPANLVMRGFDHLAAVRDLAPFIVHTHAKYIVSQVRLDLRNDVFHRGFAPLALQDAPICRVFPRARMRSFRKGAAKMRFYSARGSARHPLGGPSAALQTSRAVQHFRSLHGLLKCFSKNQSQGKQFPLPCRGRTLEGTA